MICIWSSWYHCHPIIFCSSKIQNGLPFSPCRCDMTYFVLLKVPLELNQLTNQPNSFDLSERMHKFRTTTTMVLTALFLGPPGEPVPAENFWTLWCKGRLTEADTPTIRMGATPSGLVTSAHLHHPPYFLQAGCPSWHPTKSIKAPKATSAFGLGRRR